jgi:hypothetical protein
MDATAPTNIADYLARFASAVVPLNDFYVWPDAGDEPNGINIFLHEHSTFTFRPVDDEGNFGMILYFDDIKVPQAENLFDLQVIFHLPFDDFKIMETPDNHTLLILYVDEEEVTKITATGDDKLLAGVEWGV